MHRQDNFTAYEVMPEALAVYLSHNGAHFNSKCCKFAVSQMYKTNEQGDRENITILSTGEVESILKRHNIEVRYAQLDDITYVANMCMFDYYKSSVPEEEHLAKYIKDTLDDPDGCDGLVFNRWIADMKWIGIAIPWEKFL